MPNTMLADFFNLINIPMFDSFSALLVIAFIVWEVPRSVKLISDEYTKGLYPESGRVADFALLFLGLISIGYFVWDNNVERIVAFLKTPGITSAFLVLMLAIPIIIVMGFFKRTFSRLDGNNSVTVFITHAFLDLAHTLFHIALVVMFVPAIGFLIFGRH
ncbi:MAG: hypothetical protein V1827_02970 [Candidatus Micrarchaeota archaeon]